MANNGALLNSNEQRHAAMQAPPYGLVVEDAPQYRSTDSRLYFSTIMALVLAILGSSTLPLSYAFAKIGILTGVIVATVVALCNTYTCVLLLRAAERTGTNTYEELSFSVGGRPLMVFTQASNLILLFGNLFGDLCLLADLGYATLTSALGSKAPEFLVGEHGRGIMLMLVLFVVLPLSLMRGMRALTYVSSGGVVLLLVLMGVIGYDAWESGFYGITSGEVPLWNLNLRDRALPESFALIGFSFYLHPLMMPLLAELPEGPEGIEVAVKSVKFVIMVVALSAFSFLGILGAAAFGDETKGDIMLNQLVTSRPFAALLAVCVLCYIASCVPPLIYSMRAYMDFLIAGPRATFKLSRFLTETLVIILLPLLLALHNAGVSEKAYAVTGATGVCIVCYIIPVLVHLTLKYSKTHPNGMISGRPAAEIIEGVDELVELLPRDEVEKATGLMWFMDRIDTVLACVVLVVGCWLSALALVTM